MPNGSRDTSFNPGIGTDAIIETVLIQPDGKILVAGRFSSFDGVSAPRLVRLNPDGSRDAAFAIGSGFDKYVYAFALQSDQKIIVGGSFLSYNGVAQKRLLRLHPNGSLDTTFESGVGLSKGDVRSILVQPDDRILVGGTFSGTYKNVSSLRLIRLLKSGNIDGSFDAPLNNKVFTMCFSSDYKLLIGGDFNSVSGISKHRIARLKLCLESTTWDGTSWSNGFPSGGKELFFKEDYPSLTTANVCSCTIDADKKVTLLSGNTLSIEFAYSGSGTLILEDAANLYQSDDDIVNNGIIHLKRKSAPILKYDYTYWSSPVENQTLTGVSPSTTGNRFYSYDPVVRIWKQENGTNTMSTGKGYIIQGPSNFSTTVASPYEATFKGIPKNGKIGINLNIGVVIFNLVGNPYPSTLNADVFLKENASRIRGTLYFWTHNTPLTNNKYTSDDYAVYNLLGGIGTRGALANGLNESVPDNSIASGQAFFVACKTPGMLEFNNSMRMKQRNSTFFKTSESHEIAKDVIEKHRIWLNLKNDGGVFKQILIGYMTGASNAYDEDYDAESFNGNQFANFYSIVENKQFSIQARGLPFEQTDSVLLGYSSIIEGEFTIAIDHLDSQFLDSDIYIEDKEMKVMHNLKKGGYFFKTGIGTFDDRFELKYVDKKLDLINFENPENAVFVMVKDKQLVIKSTNQLINEVVVYDIQGRKIFMKTKVDRNDLVIQRLNILNQVLIIKVILENRVIVVKKVVL